MTALLVACASLVPGAAGTRASVEGPEWTRIPAPAFDGVAVTDIKPTADGFVAIGYGDAGLAAVLGDRSATIWERHDMPPAGCKAAPLDVAASPFALVAVGSILEGACDVGGSWWSSDGSQWVASELGDTGMQSELVWTGDLFLAVGGRPVGETFEATTWTSADGRSWLPDSAQAQVLPELTTLIVTADGVFAAGIPKARQPVPSLVLRWSTDGWQPTGPADLGGWDVARLAEGPGGLVALVGTCRDIGCNTDAAFTSRDGSSWAASTALPDDPFPERLTGYPGGVVGHFAVDGRLQWFSPDGISWTTTDVPGPTGPIGYGHGLLVGGSSSVSESGSIWTSQVELPATDIAPLPPASLPPWLIAAAAGVGAAWLVGRLRLASRRS